MGVRLEGLIQLLKKVRKSQALSYNIIVKKLYRNLSYGYYKKIVLDFFFLLY